MHNRYPWHGLCNRTITPVTIATEGFMIGYIHNLTESPAFTVKVGNIEMINGVFTNGSESGYWITWHTSGTEDKIPTVYSTH